MSQYPNPYPGPPAQQPPGYPMGYASAPMQTDPLAPARRASVMMFVLGSLGLLCGLCMGVMANMPFEQMIAQQGGTLPPLPSGFSYSMLPKLFGAIAILALLTSVAQLVIGAFVRKGSGTASMCGIVLTSLLVLYFAANTIFAVISGQGGVAVLVTLVIAAAYIWALFLLVQAFRAAGPLKNMQAAYNAQYWQYLQQQQAYNAAAYNQNAYNAPPAGPAQPGGSQTGWQWPATPPPPADAPPQDPQNPGGPHGQGPQ